MYQNHTTNYTEKQASAEEQFRFEWSRVSGYSDENRPIFVTEFPGNYGRAGLVITRNGTPLHGLIVLLFDPQLVHVKTRLGRFVTVPLNQSWVSKGRQRFGDALQAFLRERGAIE